MAAERLAPHAPGENFDGFSSDVGSGGGGVLGVILTCGLFELALKNPRPHRDVIVPFELGTDDVDVLLPMFLTSTSSLPNLKRPVIELEGVGGSEASFSSFNVFVRRSSRNEYANANVLARSSTGRRCNNVMFSEKPPSNNSSRCDLISITFKGDVQ